MVFQTREGFYREEKKRVVKIIMNSILVQRSLFEGADIAFITEECGNEWGVCV